MTEEQLNEEINKILKDMKNEVRVLSNYIENEEHQLMESPLTVLTNLSKKLTKTFEELQSK
jgi:hypothetical protein